jgi:hypothetical protein
LGFRVFFCWFGLFQTYNCIFFWVGLVHRPI